MINILRKEDCVGCNACVQICPKNCISFDADEQGFHYPLVDLNLCINCGLCEKVCPVINQEEPKKPYKTYAAINPDHRVRHDSSSGGVFHALATKIITEGGVVFGARFNEEWNVMHDSADTRIGIKPFLKSKYVQSQIGNTYRQTEDYLKSGKKVLFSGTPCQIAGLHKFLRKDYGDLLITIDTACHGVPSPFIWQLYLKYIAHQENFSTSDIRKIDFRDKRNGWETYGMNILFKNSTYEKDWFSSMKKNVYMQGFIKNLYLRPSCYACPTKCGKALSDITLADFWGIRNIHPELYSDKGVSLILANTQKGDSLLASLMLKLDSVAYEEVVTCNPALIKSALRSNYYDRFWRYYSKNGKKIFVYITKLTKPSLFSKAYRKILYLIKQIINF